MGKQLTKVNEVYEYLMSELIQRNYKSGERLVISQISKKCNTSETPVREALRMLESDGSVKISANRGAIVVGFTRETILNIAEVKSVLGGYATRVCIDYLSPNDIRELYNINEQMYAALENNEVDLYSELNFLFHNTIYEHLPNADLLDLIHKVWDKWHFTTRVFSVTPQRMASSYQEHLTILSMIEKKMYKEVEEYVRQHKSKALFDWSEDFPSETIIK